MRRSLELLQSHQLVGQRIVHHVQIKLPLGRVTGDPRGATVQHDRIVAAGQMVLICQQGGTPHYITSIVDEHTVDTFEGVRDAVLGAPLLPENHIAVVANADQLRPLGVEVGAGSVLGEPSQAVGPLGARRGDRQAVWQALVNAVVDAVDAYNRKVALAVDFIRGGRGALAGEEREVIRVHATCVRDQRHVPEPGVGVVLA